MIRLPLAATVAACLAILPLQARELPTAKPESVGMSTERLARIDADSCDGGFVVAQG